MQVYEKYISPIGDIVLAADDQGLTCLRFDEKGLETAKEHTENLDTDISKLKELEERFYLISRPKQII